VELKTQYRQRDARFVRALHDLRMGRGDTEDVKWLVEVCSVPLRERYGLTQYVYRMLAVIFIGTIFMLLGIFTRFAQTTDDGQTLTDDGQTLVRRRFLTRFGSLMPNMLVLTAFVVVGAKQKFCHWK
jgi:hypothetical protein